MKKTKQQTAVEWLVDQLKEQIIKSAHNKLGTNRTGDYRIGLSKAIDFCEQAKEMEKQELVEAYKEGCFDSILDEKTDKIRAEEYYNQKFRNEED